MRFLPTAHLSPLTSHVSPLTSYLSPLTSYLSPSILIVPAEPDVGLVPPLRRAVEPLVHPPHGVQSAGVAGVGVVNNAVLQRERAHARPLPSIGGHVGAGSGCHPFDGALALVRLPLSARLPHQRVLHRLLALVVVLDQSVPLLLLGEGHVEVGVEVAAV